MANILDKIIEDKKESLKGIKEINSLDALENKIKSLNNFLNFKEAVANNKGVSLITEIKKASPSAGELVKDFNHLDIAKMYVDNGATCLSVLTEEKHFLGKLDYIKDIKNKFKIPVLAKDFFIDPYQIALTKSFGGDCVLIIIAALDGILPSYTPSLTSFFFLASLTAFFIGSFLSPSLSISRKSGFAASVTTCLAPSAIPVDSASVE